MDRTGVNEHSSTNHPRTGLQSAPTTPVRSKPDRKAAHRRALSYTKQDLEDAGADKENSLPSVASSGQASSPQLPRRSSRKTKSTASPHPSPSGTLYDSNQFTERLGGSPSTPIKHLPLGTFGLGAVSPASPLKGTFGLDAVSPVGVYGPGAVSPASPLKGTFGVGAVSPVGVYGPGAVSPVSPLKGTFGVGAVSPPDGRTGDE